MQGRQGPVFGGGQHRGLRRWRDGEPALSAGSRAGRRRSDRGADGSRDVEAAGRFRVVRRHQDAAVSHQYQLNATSRSADVRRNALSNQARQQGENMIIDHDRLRAFANRIVAAGGSSPDEAAIVADHLVEANLRGHDSHGVGMLVAYVRDFEAGTLKVNQTPEIVSDTGTISVWDARAGYGQVIAHQAVEWAIEAARQHGVAVNGLRNAHHIGRVGTYGEIAARAGMVALHFVNVASGAPGVAPFRGREGRFLTNPVCIAIPGTSSNEPILLDFATSRVALGKVRVAHNAGKPMLEGALLDHAGQPTTDPSVMYVEPRGVVLPFGEHKGSGLALVCELLAGAIVGSASVTTSTPPERGILNGMLSIVIDPARLSARDSMMSEIDAMIAWVKSAKPADPELPVLVAGEPERLARAERIAHGIEIDKETWSQLSAIAERYQIALDR